MALQVFQDSVAAKGIQVHRDYQVQLEFHQKVQMDLWDQLDFQVPKATLESLDCQALLAPLVLQGKPWQECQL